MKTDKKSFQVEWFTKPEEGRNDAVWYYGAGCMGTATLTTDTGSYSLNIYCDGETLVKIPYNLAEPDNVEYVRYADQFAAMGYQTDADLARIDEMWWEHNSWFDLYTEDGEHLDCVTHEIPDAIAQAEATLREVAARGEW